MVRPVAGLNPPCETAQSAGQRPHDVAPPRRHGDRLNDERVRARDQRVYRIGRQPEDLRERSEIGRAVVHVNSGTPEILQRDVVGQADGDVDLAKADVTSDAFQLGVVEDASIASAASGKIVFRRGAVISGYSGLTPGKLQYVSRATAGAMTESLAGFVAGEFVYSIGRALSATELVFDPQFEYEN